MEIYGDVDTSLLEDNTVKRNIKTPFNAGSTAVYAGMASSPENYVSIKQELDTTGESPTLTKIEADIKENTNESLKEVVADIASKGDVNATEQAVFSYQDIVRQRPDVIKEALHNMQAKFNVNIEKMVNVKRAEDALLYNVNRGVEEDSYLESAGEFLTTAFVPFSDLILSTGIVPAEQRGSAFSWILSGEGKVALQDKYKEMSLAEREEFLGKLQEGVDSFREITGHDLATAGFIGDILDPTYRDSVFRVVDDVVGILDSTVVGSITLSPILKLVKGGKVALSTARTVEKDSVLVTDSTSRVAPINTTAPVAPEISQDLMEAVLNSDEVAMELAGTNRAEAVRSKMMPKFDREGIEIDTDPMPSTIKDEQAYLNKVQSDLFYHSGDISGIQLTKREQQAQLAQARKDLENVNTISLRDSSVQVTNTEGSFDVYAKYGKTSTDGWRYPSVAIAETAEALAKFGIDQKDVRLAIRNPETGKDTIITQEALRQMSPDEIKELGEFHTIVSFNKYWDNTGVKEFKQSSTSLPSLGRVGDYFLNPVNRYQKEVVRVANAMKDRGVYVTERLKTLSAPIEKLNEKSKMKVIRFIREGDKKGKRYSVEELNGLVKQGDLTDQEMGAILSNYRLWDTVYMIDNRSLARRFEEKGTWILSGKNADGNEFKLFGKPVEVDSVKNEKLLDLSSDILFKGNPEGRRVIKLKNPQQGKDGQIYEYAIVPSSVDTIFRAVRHTDKVLSYRKGYYPRRYRGDYYVDRVVTKDGKEISRSTIGNAEDTVQASRLVEMMDRDTESPNIKFEYRRSEELRRGLREGILDEDELFDGLERGRSMQMYRGQPLGAYDDGRLLEMAPTLDPIETIVNSAFNTGRVAMHLDGIEALKNRWLKSYGDLLGAKRFPRSESDIPLVKGVDDKTIAEATDMFRFIRAQSEVYDKHFIEWAMKFLSVNTAEALDRLGVPALGNMARLGKDFDPVKGIRSLAFLEYIVGYPTRQALLQTLQLTQVAPLTKKYANPVRLISDITNLKRLLASEANTKVHNSIWKKLASNGGGYDEADWKALYSNFKRSGLPYSIDTNQLVEGLTRSLGGEIYDSSLKTYASKGLDIAKSPFRFAKRIGFDFGESTNLTGTFLVAAERYAKSGNKKLSNLTSRDWAKIADDARRLSWNMNKVDRFAYQQGLLSVPLMYAQVFHKAFLYYALGNKTLTKAERAKIVATNSLLFTGMFTPFFLEDEVDAMPEPAKEIYERGLFSYSLNGMIGMAESGLTGQDIDTDLNFSSLFPSYNLTDTALEYVSDLLEFNLSEGSKVAGYVALGRVRNGAVDVYNTISGDFGEDISTPEKAVSAMMAVGSLFSQLDKATRAWAGYNLEKTSLTNSAYDPIIEASLGELGVYTLFGVNKIEAEELFKLSEQFYGKGGSVEGDSKYVKNIAREYYRVLQRVTVGKSREGELKAMQYFLSNIDDFNKQAIIREVISLDKKSNSNYKDRLVYNLLKNRTTLSQDNIDEVRNYANNYGSENLKFFVNQLFGEK